MRAARQVREASLDRVAVARPGISSVRRRGRVRSGARRCVSVGRGRGRGRHGARRGGWRQSTSHTRQRPAAWKSRLTMGATDPWACRCRGTAGRRASKRPRPCWGGLGVRCRGLRVRRRSAEAGSKDLLGSSDSGRRRRRPLLEGPCHLRRSKDSDDGGSRETRIGGGGRSCSFLENTQPCRSVQLFLYDELVRVVADPLPGASPGWDDP